jgi:hypothetical protein
MARKTGEISGNNEPVCRISLITSTHAFCIGTAVQAESYLILAVSRKCFPTQTMGLVQGKAKGSLFLRNRSIIEPAASGAHSWHVFVRPSSCNNAAGEVLLPSLCKEKVQIHGENSYQQCCTMYVPEGTNISYYFYFDWLSFTVDDCCSVSILISELSMAGSQTIIILQNAPQLDHERT